MCIIHSVGWIKFNDQLKVPPVELETIVVVTEGLFGFKSPIDAFLPYPVIVCPETFELFFGFTRIPSVPLAFPVSIVNVLTSPRDWFSVKATSGP